MKSPRNLYFVYEYCNQGSLENILMKRGQLPEKEGLLIMKQMINAFKTLVKFKFMHRNLEPKNIFFNDSVAKIGNFNSCKSLSNMAKTMLSESVYSAPEVLKGMVYTSKADVWSLGIILYEILHGFCPFNSGSGSIPGLMNAKQIT